MLTNHVLKLQSVACTCIDVDATDAPTTHTHIKDMT